MQRYGVKQIILESEVIKMEMMKQFLVRVFENNDASMTQEVVRSFVSSSFDECKTWMEKNVKAEQFYEIYQRVAY